MELMGESEESFPVGNGSSDALEITIVNFQPSLHCLRVEKY